MSREMGGGMGGGGLQKSSFSLGTSTEIHTVGRWLPMGIFFDRNVNDTGRETKMDRRKASLK